MQSDKVRLKTKVKTGYIRWQKKEEERRVY
jgi:hypothetical protein